MNVILIDRKMALAIKHAAPLVSDGHSVWYWDVNEAKLWARSTFVWSAQAPNRYELGIVHLGDVQSLDDACEDCKRVVIYSGDGNAHHEAHPGIKLPVGIDSPIPPETLRRICKLAQSAPSNEAWRKGIDELLNEEPLLAFCLLCAAARECDGQGEHKRAMAFGTGFTIHAPKDLGEWLKPFGDYEKGKELERIEEVASMIASEPVRAAVMGVFNAVGGTSLLEMVGKFEKALNNQQS